VAEVKKRKRRKVGTRPSLPELVKRRIWVRSGGRCAICNRDLLDGGLTDEPVSLGELAHIVGQKDTAGSPRGKTKYPTDKRDEPDNILLACGECHDEFDDPKTLTAFTVEKLRDIKQAHEERIKHVTGLGGDRRTVVLRVLGHVRAHPVELTKTTAMEAIIASGERFPHFALTYDRQGIEIDLRPLAGEEEGSDGYYQAAQAAIDEGIDHALRDGLAKGNIEHVSVFAFARLPLLVHLGRKLDDVHGVELYQRHRSTEGWVWPSDADGPQFKLDVTAALTDKAEAVLILNVSGSIHPNEIPERLRGLPLFRLYPDGAPAQADTIESKKALQSYKAALRLLFAQLEAEHKSIRMLHVFAALPITAAVELGRVPDPVVHPAMQLYDRLDDGTYRAALVVG
jgi:hypothetical protein